MELHLRRRYFVYLLSDPGSGRLKAGLTDDLAALLAGQERAGPAEPCLLYWEAWDDPAIAVQRETELSDYSVRKKRALIRRFNPESRCLNRSFPAEAGGWTAPVPMPGAPD